MSAVFQRQKSAAVSSQNKPNSTSDFPGRREAAVSTAGPRVSTAAPPGLRVAAARPRVSTAPPSAPRAVPRKELKSNAGPAAVAKPDAEILFQKYFKSVGPRTYAAQLKKAGNGNHFLVFTEGKRDEKTGEIRKTRLFVFSEDFAEFFKMLHETACYIRQNPVPAEVRKKREKYWARQREGAGSNGSGRAARPRNARP
jgi:hypothetical protein